MPVALALVAWLACTAVGLILIDLDTGPRLLSLTMGHGVTVTDAIGAALLLAGWLAAVLTARRRRLAYRISTPGPLLSAVALLASVAGVLTAALLVPDFPHRRFVVVGFVLLVEAAAGSLLVSRRPADPSRPA